jgi:hypothetical protein
MKPTKPYVTPDTLTRRLITRSTIKAIAWLLVCIFFIWITVTDDYELRISMRSKHDALTADYIAERIAECVAHAVAEIETSTYDNSPMVGQGVER